MRALEVTTLLEVLVAFSGFLDPVSAAPQRRFENGLSRRADKTAGIGVELEFGQIVIKGPKDFTPEQLEKLKGAEMIPDGVDGGQKTNWKLTAEIPSGGGAKTLMPEAIVDGTKNEVGAHKTKQIGGEVFNFLKAWNPHRPAELKIPGHDDLGPFTVQWPKDPKKIEDFTISPQVTTAMPLAAILQILDDSTAQDGKGKGNPLAGASINRSKFKILKKADFSAFQKIKQSDIDDDFLGYFSILTSYCVLAKDGKPSEGPKQLLNIMPRTDFSTQYNKFIEPKLKEQLKDKSLYDIVKAVSQSGDGLAQESFKWVTTRPKTDVSDDWNGKAGDLQSGNLAVGKFLNYIQGWDTATKKELPKKDLVKLMDKALRHGQVGGLGATMENMFESKKEVPIFEFRDFTSVTAGNVADKMGSYEDKVIDYHRKFGKDESVNNAKPSKGKALSIAMRTTVSPHAGYADTDVAWEFYTTSVGKAVDGCGKTDGEKLTPKGPSETGLPTNLSTDNPPWPGGEFKLTIEGVDCTYKCNGKNAGRLFCPNREIACVEDSAKSKKDATKMCGTMSFFKATVYCDF